MKPVLAYLKVATRDTRDVLSGLQRAIDLAPTSYLREQITETNILCMQLEDRLRDLVKVVEAADKPTDI